ncbi:WXG100 family type VII secretion target [Paenibacillus sp. Marseille-Q7038]
MRIRVEPNVLRTLSSQLKLAAEQIQQTIVVLERALSTIEGDTAVHEGIVYEWMRSKQLASYIETELERFSSELSRKAEDFTRADEDYHTVLSYIDYSNVSPMRMLQSQQITSLRNNELTSFAVSNPKSALMAIHPSGSSDEGNGLGVLLQASETNPRGWIFKDPVIGGKAG